MESTRIRPGHLATGQVSWDSDKETFHSVLVDIACDHEIYGVSIDIIIQLILCSNVQLTIGTTFPQATGSCNN